MIEITEKILRTTCLISEHWISNRMFCINKCLVKNAALFSTIDIAKAAFPNLRSHHWLNKGMEHTIPKNRKKFIMTDWMYRSGSIQDPSDHCLMVSEDPGEREAVYIYRRYYDSILRPFNGHVLWGASHNGCMVLTNEPQDNMVKIIIAGIIKQREFPIIDYSGVDALLGGGRKLDL